jgi:hypothetical protein
MTTKKESTEMSMLLVNEKGEYVDESCAEKEDWIHWEDQYVIPVIGSGKYSVVLQCSTTSKETYDKLLMESMLYSYWGRRLSGLDDKEKGKITGDIMSGSEITKKIPRN